MCSVNVTNADYMILNKYNKPIFTQFNSGGARSRYLYQEIPPNRTQPYLVQVAGTRNI